MRGTEVRRSLGVLALIAFFLPARSGADELVRIQGVPGQPIAIGQARFVRTFVVESATTSDIDIRVKALRLCGPAEVMPELLVNGEPLDGGPVKLLARDVLEVTLRADLPLEGRYQGALSVLPADQARVSAPFTVERAAAPSPLEVELLPTVRAWARHARISLDVHAVSAPAGGLRLQPPRLVSLAQKGAGSATWQPQDAYTVQVKDADDLLLNGPILVIGDRALRLHVRGLGAGEYSGTVRVEAESMKAIDKPVTLVVKEPWWVAGLLILISAGVAWVLRAYLKVGRPRLVTLQRISHALDAVDATAGAKAPLGEAEAATWRELQRQAERLAAQLDGGTAPDAVAPAVAALEEKPELLRIWIEAARSCAEAKRAGRTVDATIEQKVGTAHATLMNAAASAADVIARTSELAAERERLVTLNRAARKAEIEGLLAEARAAARPKEVERARLLDAVIAALQRASDALEADALLEARKRYQEARLQLARLRGRELADRLRTLPMELEPCGEALRASLQPTLDVVDAATDADPAVEGVERATRELATRWLDALGQRAAQSVRVADEVKAGTEKLAKGDLAGAIASCERASAALGAAPTAAWGAAAAGPKPLSVPEARAWTVAAPGKLRRVQRALRGARANVRVLDVATNLALLGIAVLLGLQVLWVNDPTWGDANAFIVAVLWGAGVHAISGVTFEGIAGLRERFAK